MECQCQVWYKKAKLTYVISLQAGFFCYEWAYIIQTFFWDSLVNEVDKSNSKKYTFFSLEKISKSKYSPNH